MRLERSKNLIRNLKWGVLYRLSGLLIPFVCKAAIIRIFGINYLGLNSLFASVISTLNLAELGFGSVVVFFMYKEIAEENASKICALLNYYKRVYRIIGTIVLLVGLALMPFLKYLIKKDIPADINIYIIYVITLAATVLSYFLFAYKTSILTAFQRESVLYKIRAAVLVSESIAQILAIFVLKNYYAYMVSMVTQIKMFPDFDRNSKLAIIGGNFEMTYMFEDFGRDNMSRENFPWMIDDWREQFIKYYGGFDIEMATKEEKIGLILHDDFKNMAIYPYPGSIKKIGDYLVVKMKKFYAD